MILGVNVLMNLIIYQYFLNSRCLIILTDERNTFDYTGDVPIVNINVEEYNIPKVIFNYFGCQGIVIKCDRPLTIFKQFENHIRLNMERFNTRKYLLVPGTNPEENLSDIFNFQELKYVADIVMIEEILTREEKYVKFLGVDVIICNLFTHRYGGAGNNNEPVLLDTWFSKNQSFMYRRDLFPNKLLNQMGRPLKMATFQYEPYTIIGSGTERGKGSEMSTALTFATVLNMTPVLVVNDEDYWGEIYDNWTGIGLLGNLVADRADIGFAALYTWEKEYHFLDLSKPLIRTGITCLVPSPKLAAGWLTPLYSYSPAMWVAVCILWTVCILSLFLAHYIYGEMKYAETMNQNTPQRMTRLMGQSVFSIVKLSIVQAVTKAEIPDGFAGTYFMGWFLMGSLFLSSTYSSGLSSIMTIPRYEDSIDTVAEFARSELDWGATDDAWIMSIQNNEEPTYQKIVGRFKSMPDEELREHSKSGKFAFSLERLPNDNYAVGTYVQADVIGNYHLLLEDLYWEQCLLMARKNSVLLPLLDMFIMHVFEAGLVSYWQNEAVILYMDSQVQKALKFYHYKNDQNIVKLKWTHVEGAFGILCLGYIFSAVVFLLEMFVNKFKNNNIDHSCQNHNAFLT